MNEQSNTLTGWCIVELMGHVRLAGMVTEEQHFGSALGRIDVHGGDDKVVTIYFGGGSVYRITPTTEEIARRVAAHDSPAPVARWDLALPQPRVGHAPPSYPESDDNDQEYEDEDDLDEDGIDRRVRDTEAAIARGGDHRLE